MECTMPKATHDSITIPPAPPLPARRAFMTGTAYATIAALGAAGVLYTKADAATPHPDAELIAIGQEAAPLIAEYRAIYARFFALPHGHPDHGTIADEGDAPSERIAVLLTRANELRATTVAGARAKALLAADDIFWQHAGGGVLEVDQFDEGELLVWGLVTDLLAMGEAA
jgi:hypothetical protein